ncbi:MAG: Ig-like domain-containing protein, partial [Tannerella sp.]|nr:Ig-like domain-containing protein [Tannerella sp.]
MRQILRKSYRSKMSVLFLGIMLTALLQSCISEEIEYPPPTIELRTGYTTLLTDESDNAKWNIDNPTIATISADGLLTAHQAGKATVYSVNSKGKQKVFCYLEVFPRRNILFYIGGDNNLSDASRIGGEPVQKINRIRTGWQQGKGEMIIFADNGAGAFLLRINETKGADGMFGLDTLKTYGTKNSASKEVLSQAITDFVSGYPADSYGMIFFSHASGWLPDGTLSNPRSSLRSLVIDENGTPREMEYYDFATAIPDHQFDFIIFEACLMADVMTMYDLRNKATYVLASSAEIVSPGFEYTYQDTVMSLYNTKQSVDITLQEFGQAYFDRVPTVNYNAATLSLIKMSEMDNLATATKTALQGISVEEDNLSIKIDGIQTFDRPSALGGRPYSRFFDFGHTVQNIVSEAQYNALNTQIGKTVVWKVATESFL